MEKKNTILLTVIAIATLLVAVVGATFAYFTANVTSNNDKNSTTSARTYTLASAVMEKGNDVSSAGVYPGTTIVKPLVITGGCDDAKGCQSINTIIEVTAKIDEGLGEDVTWYLFKGTQENPTGNDADGNPNKPITNEITCEYVNHTDGGKYYADPGCNFNGTVVNDKITEENSGYKAIISGNSTTTSPVTTPVKVSSDTNDTYYLVVEYQNHMDVVGEDGKVTTSGEQDQQGLNYEVTVNFKPAA